MIIYVKVKPNSKEDKLEKLAENEYIAYISEPARKGKANISLVKLLAKYFDVNQERIVIKTPTGRKKVIEIVI